MCFAAVLERVHVMITRTLTGENIPPKTGVSVPTHQEESARILHCLLIATHAHTAARGGDQDNTPNREWLLIW